MDKFVFAQLKSTRNTRLIVNYFEFPNSFLEQLQKAESLYRPVKLFAFCKG